MLVLVLLLVLVEAIRFVFTLGISISITIRINISFNISISMSIIHSFGCEPGLQSCFLQVRAGEVDELRAPWQRGIRCFSSQVSTLIC